MKAALLALGAVVGVAGVVAFIATRKLPDAGTITVLDQAGNPVGRGGWGYSVREELYTLVFGHRPGGGAAAPSFNLSGWLDGLAAWFEPRSTAPIGGGVTWGSQGEKPDEPS